MNTSLKSDLQTSVYELENMKVDWKISTLIYFDNTNKLSMNGFMSWYIWIKKMFNNNRVVDYNLLNASQRK